jgi:hypothetical protein
MLATVLKCLIIKLKNIIIQAQCKSWYHAEKLYRGRVKDLQDSFLKRAEKEMSGRLHILAAFGAGNGPHCTHWIKQLRIS